MPETRADLKKEDLKLAIDIEKEKQEKKLILEKEKLMAALEAENKIREYFNKTKK